MNIVDAKGLDVEINCKVIDYFRLGYYAKVMGSNKISIQIATGDIIYDGDDTHESICESFSTSTR